MGRPVKSLLGSLAVYLFISCASLFAGALEAYSVRPDIVTVSPVKPTAGNTEIPLIRAHVAFIAELLETYPQDTHIYFLARDAENLFDVAKLLTLNSADAKRIHLLNISRANMYDEKLRRYLSENGISDKSLSAGKKVLFVDTGFAGTIPNAVSTLFKSENAERMKTHLIVSANPKHPSSRVFLSFLNPLANSESPRQMHNTIVQYEHMPRFTQRADGFIEKSGKLIPASGRNDAETIDGKVSKKDALKFMEHLRFYTESREGQKLFNTYRKLISQIRRLLVNENVTRSKEILLGLLSKDSSGTTEAIVRDLTESRENAGLAIQLTRTDLGLKDYYDGEKPKKMQLIDAHPEWAQYIEDPVIGIPKLFKEENWGLVSTFLDTEIDDEISEILVKGLFDGPATGFKETLQISYLENLTHGSDLTDALYDYPFQKNPEFLEFLIKHTNKESFHYISEFFGRPEILKLKGPRHALFNRGINVSNWLLEHFRFENGVDPATDEALVEVLSKPDWNYVRNFPGRLFQHPELADSTKMFRLFCEKVDSRIVEDTRVPDLSKWPKAKIMIEAAKMPRAFQKEKQEFIDRELAKLESAHATKPMTCEKLF